MNDRATLTSLVGHTLGREVEGDFNRKAAESGLSDEETKNAFNQNMLSTGLLADGPREYSDTFDRRWLVTNYEAGDVVLHNPFAVGTLQFELTYILANSSQIHASTMNHDPNNVIRVGTDLRFVDGSKPWDTVSTMYTYMYMLLTSIAMGQRLRVQRRCVSGSILGISLAAMDRRLGL